MSCSGSSICCVGSARTGLSLYFKVHVWNLHLGACILVAIIGATTLVPYHLSVSVLSIGARSLSDKNLEGPTACPCLSMLNCGENQCRSNKIIILNAMTDLCHSVNQKNECRVCVNRNFNTLQTCLLFHIWRRPFSAKPFYESIMA